MTESQPNPNGPMDRPPQDDQGKLVPPSGDQASGGQGALVPPPITPGGGLPYQPTPMPAPMPPPTAFPPPPGTQYGNVQYGSTPPPGYPAGQYPGGAYPGGPYDSVGGPYGYPQGYLTGPPPGTNGMAIASLVLGICGFFCVTPFIGLGLGIAALSKINRTGQSGKGLAVAGCILSGLWIALIVLSLVTGGFHLNVNSG